jgi:hypothetical protein
MKKEKKLKSKIKNAFNVTILQCKRSLIFKNVWLSSNIISYLFDEHDIFSFCGLNTTTTTVVRG